jgi:hypothetical protein
MLKTVRLKPNPAGKDRTRAGATAAQLAAEWVDLKNLGNDRIDLTGVVVKHVAYAPGAVQGHWEVVQSFSKGILSPGQVVRFHAGQDRGVGVIRAEDLSGADFHLFTGDDRYIWNNDKADCSSLWYSGLSDPFDAAWYAANPPEGAVLVRSGNNLVVQAAVGAFASRGH